VTDAVVAGVPPGNLRVPRMEFAALWAAAEQRSREQGARGVTDWYAAGVVVTCRWLAAVIVTDQTGYRFPAYAPVNPTLGHHI
jgi:hypothetical protein